MSGGLLAVRRRPRIVFSSPHRSVCCALIRLSRSKLRSREAELGATPSVPGSPAPGRVYVIDDDVAVRRALTRLLRAEGYEATSFATAREFLASVEPDEVPACLVVDLRMPGMSGLELQDLIAQRDLELAVVFISARADVQSGVRAVQRGATDFLEKPVSNEALLN